MPRWMAVCFLPAMLLVCGAGRAYAFRDATLPEWVTQAASAQGKWGDARAVCLLSDTLVTVDAKGRATERDRVVVKILRPEGRDDASPAVEYSKDNKLESFRVWSIGPDGHRYAAKRSQYADVGVDQSGAGILYNDERVRVASPSGADPGGIVAWEDVQQLPGYATEDWWNFQSDIPTVRTTFEIDLAAGWHERAVWSRHAPVQPAEVAPNHFRWELDDVKGINLDGVPLRPAWMALAGWMSVHYSANPVPEGAALWAQIGNWYDRLALPESEAGGDIAAEAQSLVAGGDDFMTRVQKVAAFMQQQIRYVGVEIGIGGLQPHSAEEVFHSRYGDCKDKATLMIAMLDAVGIRATWVEVDDRRGVINPQAPSIQGNHMIMAIEIPQGYENPQLQAVVTTKTGQRYLIFDPTNPFVAMGQIPGYEQGSYGLLIAGKESQVVELPVLSPDAATTERRGKFQVAADGTLTGDVSVERTGARAWEMRQRLSMDSESEQRKLMEQSLQQDLATFTLGAESVKNVNALEKPLEMQYQVTAPLYAKQAGTMLLIRPRVLGSDAYPLNETLRQYPISFSGVGTWKDDFSVKIPAGYKAADLPEAVEVNAGFATYVSDVKMTGDVLHYQRELVLKKLTLPASDYPELLKLNGAIITDENSDAVLQKQ